MKVESGGNVEALKAGTKDPERHVDTKSDLKQRLHRAPRALCSHYDFLAHGFSRP